MIMSLGAGLFAIISIGLSAYPERIAAGIAAGIGFISAVTIWAENDNSTEDNYCRQSRATAAIGLAADLGDYPLASQLYEQNISQFFFIFKHNAVTFSLENL